MKSIKRKLNNKGGATLLIILVGMLLAIMVSVVLVTASVTSAKRVVDDRKKTQAYLTLESAAKIVRDEMEETVVNIETTYTTDEEGNITSNTVETLTGKFQNEMKSVFDGNMTGNFQIQFSEEKEVSVSYEATPLDDGETYEIKFIFSIEDTKLQLSMEMQGQKISDVTEYRKSYEFGSWDNAVIKKLEE